MKTDIEKITIALITGQSKIKIGGGVEVYLNSYNFKISAGKKRATELAEEIHNSLYTGVVEIPRKRKPPQRRKQAGKVINGIRYIT